MRGPRLRPAVIGLALVTVAVVVIALGSGRLAEDAGPVVPAASPTPVIPSLTPSATQQSAAAPSPSPSDPAITVPLGPFAVGTATGGVYELRQSGLGNKIFDCGDRAVVGLGRSPDGSTLLVICSDRNGRAEGNLISSGSAARAVPFVLIPYAFAWSPDSAALALLVPSGCTPTAPVCASRVVRYELLSGRTTELSDDQTLIGNLRWSGRGLSYFRSATPGGTFLLEGGRWRLIAPDAIRAEAPDGRLLLDRVTYEGGRERHQVVLVSGQGDTVLTPAGSSERPLVFDQRGRAVALREYPTGGTAVVVYAGSTTSIVPGEMRPEAVLWADWLLAPTDSNAVAFFSLERLAFGAATSRLPQAVTVLGLRPGT